MIVNVSKAKTNLSKLVDMAFHGEEVIISKNNVPLVELIAHRPKPKRQLGLLAGQIEIPEDFMDEDDKINADYIGFGGG